jgi:hypothetical protein
MMADDLSARRRHKARQRVGAAVADALGVTAEGIAEIVGDGCPDQIRDAFASAFELGEMKRAVAERMAAEEDTPGHCCNAVCRQWRQSEGQEIVGELHEIKLTGRQSYCNEGAAAATDCLFRMRTQPPSSLDTVSCARLPEWSEAINLLRQAGLLEPDEFGRWEGTNFAFKVSRLWWALVDLLVETGRIERCWIEDAAMEDRGAQARLAKHLLFPSSEEIE